MIPWIDLFTVRPSAGEIFLASDGRNLVIAKMNSRSKTIRVMLVIRGNRNFEITHWFSFRTINLPE